MSVKLLKCFIICSLINFPCKILSQTLQVSNLTVNEAGMVSASAYIGKHHSEREVYQLSVFGSHNNYSIPLDIKFPGLTPEKSHQVSFDGAKLIGNYEGMLNFRFAITATQFPIELVNVKSKVRRGKHITLNWSDFHASGVYKVELYKSNQLINVLGERVNGTSFKGIVPKKTAKGSDYAVRVTPVSNASLRSEDSGIKVIAKTPLMVKVIPILIGGAATYVLTSQTEPDGGFPEVPGTPDQ